MQGPDQPPKPTGDPDPRSRPAIQTDPDLTIQTDPDLTIQTYDPDPFVLCWLDMFFFKVLKRSEKYYILCTTKYYSSTTLYYKVLLCTTKYDAGWSREFKIWPSRSRPRSRPFQTRSRPVPWNPRAVSIHSHVAQEEKTGLCVQCRIIWFSLSRIWNDYHDSRHSVPDVRKRHFTKVVVPDVRIIAERSRPVYRPMPIYFIEWPLFQNCSIACMYLSMSGSSTKPMDWERKQIHPWIPRIHRPPQAPRQKFSGWQGDFLCLEQCELGFWKIRSDIERFITFSFCSFFWWLPFSKET